jgi:hypothetical protein
VRRLGRILLNALTVLSLLLFLATVAMWVRSYWTHDDVDLVVRHRLTKFETYPAHLRMSFYSFWSHRDVAFDHRSFRVTPDDDVLYIPFARTSLEKYGRDLHLIVPFWLVLALTAVPFARGIIRRRRRMTAIDAGLCPSCGYDLRATPERCPECGTIADW